MNLRSRLILAAVLLLAGWGAFRIFRPEHVVNAPPAEGPYVAFGDSLTEGVGAAAGETYPDQLSRLLGVPVLNRGVSGETAEQALKRLDRDVLKLRPALVLVCLGGNDILQQRDPDGTFRALDEIVTRLTDAGAMVVLIGVEGLPLISPDFGARYEALAEEKGCLYVPDVLDGIIGRDQLMSDAIHPNGKGYGMIAERIAKRLRPYLG